MNFRSKSQRGFTLLEVLLAIGVSLSIGAVALTELRRDNESKQAKAVGQQSAMVGKALNTYLALQYNHIVSLNNSPGVGSAEDPGPRFCTANVTTVNGNPASICTITTDTLVRSGLLPTSFSGRNAFGAEYDIYIRVVGSSPNWIVEGLVVTDQPYTTGGGNRYDLLGQAMQEAGADSGMTRTLANTVEGLNGTWRDNVWPSITHDGVTYPGVNQLGLLAHRAGYGSSGYAAYLRLDGTTPMTGKLDMDSHNIENVAVLEAQSGVFNPGGGGVALSLNNADPNNRTDMVVGSGTLGIRNTGGVRFENHDGTAGANVSMGHLTAQGNITANGDMSLDGNLLARSDLTVNGNTRMDGNLSVGGAMQAASISTSGNGNIVAGGTGTVQGNTVRAVSTLQAGNYQLDNTGLTMGGGARWYYDGGQAMWRTNGSIQADGNIRGANVAADTRVQAGQYMEILGASGSAVTEGAGCSDYGQIRRGSTAAAPILTCVSGSWRRMSSGQVVTVNSGTLTSPGIGGGTITTTATCPTGARVVGGGYALVSFNPLGGGYDGNAPSQSYPNSNGWTIALDQRTGASSFQARAVCMY